MRLYLFSIVSFVLLAAFPVILLARAVPSIDGWAGAIGWGLAWWALALYWAAGALYLIQTARLLRADRVAPGARTAS